MNSDFTNPKELVKNQQFNTQLAITYQKEWAQLIKAEDSNQQPITTVAGVDIAYDFNNNRAFAVAVVLDADNLSIKEVKKAISPIEVPYRSGFLSFREAPVMTQAIRPLSKLQILHS